jgi:hypothetical protein
MLNPTCPDLIRAVMINIDELVLPQLEGPHARSAAKNIRLLLANVLYRLEHEGEALATDNGEKRSVLSTLTEQVGDLNGASELRDRLAAIPDRGSYVSVPALAEEATSLRQLMIDASLLVHRSAASLGEDKAEEVLSPLRSQLRAQLDRDSAAVCHVTPAEVYDHKGT